MGEIPSRVPGNFTIGIVAKDGYPTGTHKRVDSRKADRKEVHEGHNQGPRRQGRGFRGVFKSCLRGVEMKKSREQEIRIALDCMIQHIKAFHDQSMEDLPANFAQPCISCKYSGTCNHDWVQIMHPIIKDSEVRINMELPEPPNKLGFNRKFQALEYSGTPKIISKAVKAIRRERLFDK